MRVCTETTPEHRRRMVTKGRWSPKTMPASASPNQPTLPFSRPLPMCATTGHSPTGMSWNEKLPSPPVEISA